MGPRLPPDPILPGAVELLGDGGRAMVGRFLSDRGWSPCAVEPVQVFYRPGRSMTVRFDVRARRRGGPLDVLTVAAECQAGDPVRVWAFPEDPSLPGLPASVEFPVTDGDGVRATEMLRYRPRRRAVLRYRFPVGGVLFGKVLPPARARRALEATGALCPDARPELRLALPAAGPAPGALVVAPVDGRPLRDLLLAGDTLPSPTRLARLSEDLAGMIRPSLRRPLAASPAATRVTVVSEAAGLTGHLLPSLRPTLDEVLAAVAHAIDSDPPDRHPVHGDLYEAQLLVGDDGTLGLLDLDDLGLGDPLLDAATFSAHLVALALQPGPATTRILAYRAELRRAFLDRLGAPEHSLR
ncbi:MAG TPA: phosphotransferase, partial [Acidimicrobiia bacterium]